MKCTLHPVALLAALSVGLAVSSCSTMLNALSESLNELNEKIASAEIVPVPAEGQAQAAARAEARKSASTTSSTAVAQSPTKSTTATAPAAAPKNVTVHEFVGTPYKVLPAGTDGSVGTSGSYVLFGDWPQTIKAANVTVDESQVAYVGAFTYFKGSDGAWYVKILEDKASGYEGPNGFRYSDGSRVQFYYKKSYRYFKVEPIKWRILTSNYNGTGKKLLLAESALTSEMFCETFGDHSHFENMDGNHYAFTLDVTIRQLENGTYIHHNNYEHSRIRAFLNGIAYIQGDENIYVKGLKPYTRVNEEFVGRGFLQTAFTPALQSKIAVTTVDNSSRQNSGLDLLQTLTALDRSLYDGTMYYERGEEHKRVYFPKLTSNNTKDKVFLLSPKEVTRKDYGFIEVPPTVTAENVMSKFWAGEKWKSSEQTTTYKGLARPLTDFTRAHGSAHFDDETTTTWWLRTPLLPVYFHTLFSERLEQQVVGVNDYPTLFEMGVSGRNGVVPAICVN